MKKTLLLSALGLLAAGSMSAFTPEKLPGMSISKMSPDGRYMVSEMNGTMTIIDITTGAKMNYVGDYDLYEYTSGHGNAFSDNGIFVGSTLTNGGGNYWKDGEWYAVQGVEKFSRVYTNGISANGRMIVGDANPLDHPDVSMDGTMLYPYAWEDKDGDGTYETEIALPYPSLDLFNRAPQYITALCVNPDGSKIFGQVVDYSGQFNYPIQWAKNESGEWAYSYPGIELFNTEKIEIPEDPGESPEMPMPEQFMTDAEAAEYQAALDAWAADGYSDELYPNPSSYMTPEEIAAYNAAVDAYNAAAEEWNNKFMAFYEAFERIRSCSVLYVFNDCYLSPDGNTMVQNAELPGATFFDPSIYYTVVFDLVNGTVKTMPADQNVACSQLLNDGTMLGSPYPSFTSPDPVQAYIYTPGAEKYTLLYDYFQTTQPEIAEWIKNNMAFDVDSYDPETYDPIVIENMIVTGHPVCNANMSVLATTVTSQWEDEYNYNAYLFTGISTSGLKNVAAGVSTLGIKAAKGGVFTIAGDAASIIVYDLNGREVYSAANPGAVVNTGLGNGVYVAKAVDANGNATVAKVVF